MLALRAPHLWILCSTLGIVLTGCRDDSQSPPSRPEPPLDQDAPAGSMLAPIDLVYICGNKFLATNATPTSVHVVYRVAGTEESGGLTLRPGLTEEDQGHSETELETVEKGTVELYLNDERVVRRRNEGGRCGAPAISAAMAMAGDEATAGSWTTPFYWPIIALHLSLLPNGRVLSWGHTGTPQVWDPATGDFISVQAPRCCSVRGTPSCPMGACWFPADTSPTITVSRISTFSPPGGRAGPGHRRCSAAGGIPPTPHSPPATS